jgi:hypothetical protein
MRFSILASLLALPLFAACSSDGTAPEAFDTLQACFDAHHVEDALPTPEAITVCCLDHPIAGVSPACKNTQADCEAFVDAELDPSVTVADITAACADYITQKGP